MSIVPARAAGFIWKYIDNFVTRVYYYRDSNRFRSVFVSKGTVRLFVIFLEEGVFEVL